MNMAYLHRPPNAILHTHNGLIAERPPSPLDVMPPVCTNDLHPERREVRLATGDPSHSFQEARQHEAQRARNRQDFARGILLRVRSAPDRAHKIPEVNGFAVRDEEYASGDL